MDLDRAVLGLLGLSAERTTSTALLSGNGSSSATTSKITSRSSDGSEKAFFMKTSSDPAASLLVQGEHASLEAIHAAVPGLGPRSLGTGTYESSPSTSFIVIDFLQLSSPIFPTLTGLFDSLFAQRCELAAKLARLHTTPAPIPEGFTKAQFGFPVTTSCGDTPQDNSFKSSWATFFAENRLKYILQRCETYQGVDLVIRNLVQDVAAIVVPRLLGDEHLGNGNGVTPIVVHGDLWYGNVGRCIIPNGSVRDIIFDPSAFYAHSEYELGIMLMFGGFSRRFFAAYHALCPKTEPVEEYDDRLKLYQLYHYLNHFAIFGTKRKYGFFGHTYREGSLRIMRQLLQKYRLPFTFYACAIRASNKDLEIVKRGISLYQGSHVASEEGIPSPVTALLVLGRESNEKNIQDLATLNRTAKQGYDNFARVLIDRYEGHKAKMSDNLTASVWSVIISPCVVLGVPIIGAGVVPRWGGLDCAASRCCT